MSIHPLIKEGMIIWTGYVPKDHASNSPHVSLEGFRWIMWGRDGFGAGSCLVIPEAKIWLQKLGVKIEPSFTHHDRFLSAHNCTTHTDRRAVVDPVVIQIINEELENEDHLIGLRSIEGWGWKDEEA